MTRLGFEPRTNALKGHCSTVELAGHANHYTSACALRQLLTLQVEFEATLVYNPWQNMTAEIRTVSMERGEQMSRTRGSIWPEVEKYAKLGLTPGEILIARRLEGQDELPYQSVENALRKAWKRGLLPRRSPKETRDARARHLNITPADLEERVQSQLSGSRDELECIFFPRPDLLPDDPIHGKYILDLYRARKHWVDTGDRMLIDNFPDYEARHPNITSDLASQIDYIRAITPMQGNSTFNRAAQAMVIYSEIEWDG